MSVTPAAASGRPISSAVTRTDLRRLSVLRWSVLGDPLFDVLAAPDLAHPKGGDRVREALRVGDHVGALAGDATEHVSDLRHADKVHER